MTQKINKVRIDPKMRVYIKILKRGRERERDMKKILLTYDIVIKKISQQHGR